MAQPKLHDRDPTWEKAVDRMHPGPGKDYVPPVAHIETPMQKLARMEREFLETALKIGMHDPVPAGTRLENIARAVIVQRAQVTG